MVYCQVPDAESVLEIRVKRKKEERKETCEELKYYLNTRSFIGFYYTSLYNTFDYASDWAMDCKVA